MLSQLQALSTANDGRYASDAELQFMEDYLQSFDQRLQAYLAIQAAEPILIREVEAQLKAKDPQLLMRGIENFANKWRADTVRVLRISALAMLIDDPERHKQRLLYWFQTLMRAFRTQRSCDVTYQLLQDAVRKHLSPQDSELICPILELNRIMLGPD